MSRRRPGRPRSARTILIDAMNVLPTGESLLCDDDGLERVALNRARTARARNLAEFEIEKLAQGFRIRRIY